MGASGEKRVWDLRAAPDPTGMAWRLAQSSSRRIWTGARLPLPREDSVTQSAEKTLADFMSLLL